jgi:hypothetical protein
MSKHGVACTLKEFPHIHVRVRVRVRVRLGLGLGFTLKEFPHIHGQYQPARLPPRIALRIIG